MEIVEIFITFFRDILDGPLYIVIVVVFSILIASSIGYLGERYLDNKKKKQFIKNTYVEVNNKK